MLRTLGFILILLQFLAPAAVGSDALMDQELFVRLDPASHSLQGTAVLTPADGHGRWPESFRLAATAEIDEVSVDGRSVPFTFRHGLLQVLLADRPAALTIAYRIRFEDPLPEEMVGIEDPSFGVSATILPQGAFLSADSGWHPTPTAMNSRLRVTIAGPPGWTGVTAGRLVDRVTNETGTRTVWETRSPHAALAMAAGAYRVDQADLGEIQVLTLLSPGNAALAADYLDACREYLQLYQSLFGPYPYAKFAVVENFYPTGYGLPGWTLLGSSVVRLPFIRTTSLPHEIAHAWWGNSVEVDYSSGNWAEGLATYVADYYLKELQAPAEALEYRRTVLRDYAALVDADNDRPLSAFRSRMSKRDQAIGYGKAAMVFHMLRNLIGDDAFWAGLQTAAREGRGRRYGWSDLQRHFEASSGRDLGRFFHQWTDRAGAPRLQFSNVSATMTDTGWQVSGTLRQTKPYYDLAVPVRLQTAARSHDQILPVAGEKTDFLFTVSERPVSLEADPDNALFRMLYPEELPATISHLRASKVPLVVVSRGSEGLLDASRDLLRGLQWHQAPVIDEIDFLSRRPTGRDLLVLGRPQSAQLHPAPQAGLSVSDGTFRLGDRLYDSAEDVLFMVVESREDRHVTGYFLPGSIDAARDTARRIPHYGRYSYLVFSAGRNQVKATWEPASSPLKMHFEKDPVP